MKIEPESELSSHVTMTECNKFFNTFTGIVSTRGLVTHSLKLVVGATHTPPSPLPC